MGRQERFLEVLKELGGSAGNGRLRDELGWQEETYERARDALVETGLITKGRGRGGSVALAESARPRARIIDASRPKTATPTKAPRNKATRSGGFDQTFSALDKVLRNEAGQTTELDYTEQSSWMLFLKYLDDLERQREDEAELKGEAYSSIIDEEHRWGAWAAPKTASGAFYHDRALTGDDLIAYVTNELWPYLQGFKKRASGPDTIEYKIGEVFAEIRPKFLSGYSLRDALELIDGLSFGSQDQKHELDARNVRHIVLLRPVNSMIEFKQIVGRGTRLFDGKEYFTIHDFEGAYQHFLDPEWDGEPMEPVPAGPKAPTPPEDPFAPPKDPKEPGGRPEKVVIKLADGKVRTIQHISATSFWGPDGRPLSAAEFIQSLFGKAPELFKDEDELRRLWGAPDTRKALMTALAEAGFGAEPLQEMARIIDAPDSDVFDVLAYVAFALPPITRADRVACRKDVTLNGYDADLSAFLDFVLGQYVTQGVSELDGDKLPRLLELKYASASEGAAMLGGVRGVRQAFLDVQRGLFQPQEA